MNAVRDFLNDPVRLEEKLAIPAEICTQSGFLVDTTGPIWIRPSSNSNLDWSNERQFGGLLCTLQAYAGALLDGKEGTVDSFFTAVCAISKFNGWLDLGSQWLTRGEISFPSMLALKQGLSDANPKTAKSYFYLIRGWYHWAHGLRIPGFTDATVDRLEALKGKKPLSFMAQDQIAPGMPKSKSSKNRRCYTDVDFARIQAALLRLEGRLNKGEIILSRERDITSYPPHTQAAIKKNSRHIGTHHLVLGWLACLFGDRPAAFWQLRESDFTFFQADGVKLGNVRFSDEIKRGYGKLTKPAKRAPLPLNVALVRLVPKVFEENRVRAEGKGINSECDLPLFMGRAPSKTPASQARMTIQDEGARYFRNSNGLNSTLKCLFRVLDVETSDGTVIIPTFYSFRDGNHTRWARKMPLESVAAITGKKGIRSLKPYTKPGIRHIARLDEVTEYTELANWLKPPVPVEAIDPQARIPSPFPYVEDGEHRVGVEGGCGCFGSACPMAFDGTTDCYICNLFTPAVDGPHRWTLKVLIDRKADMIARGLPKSEWTRYDRHIAAIGRVIQLVQEWHRKHLDRGER